MTPSTRCFSSTFNSSSATCSREEGHLHIYISTSYRQRNLRNNELFARMQNVPILQRGKAGRAEGNLKRSGRDIGEEKCPSPSEMVSVLRLKPCCARLTFTLAITAPLGSMTVPLMLQAECGAGESELSAAGGSGARTKIGRSRGDA